MKDARDLTTLHNSLVAVIPKLLQLGQQPEDIACDLAQLALKPFSDVVLPVVNELALKLQRAHESNSIGCPKVAA